MKKRKTALVVALVLMGVAVLGLGMAVYAKYVSSFTGEGEAKVALWAFETDNQTSTVTCSMTSTVTSGAIKAAGSGEAIIIAPGTSGKCDIVVKNTTSEVKVKYTISASDVSNAPANLTLNGSAADSFTDVTGYLDMGDTETKTITWDWPYSTGETDDGEDTTDGEAAKTMTIEFTIKGEQVNPTTGS